MREIERYADHFAALQPKARAFERSNAKTERRPNGARFNRNHIGQDDARGPCKGRPVKHGPVREYYGSLSFNEGSSREPSDNRNDVPRPKRRNREQGDADDQNDNESSQRLPIDLRRASFSLGPPFRKAGQFQASATGLTLCQTQSRA